MSLSQHQVDELLAPPSDETVHAAVADYARLVRAAYGQRLKGIYLFGSRARGDHAPESDADIAVVLANDGWDYWSEKSRLTDLTYELLIDTGADLQAWPLRYDEWLRPATHRNPGLVAAMRRDGREILTVQP